MPRKMNRPEKCMSGIWQIGPDRFLVRVWRTTRSGKREKIERMTKTLGQGVDLRDRLRRGAAPPAQPTRERFDDYAERWSEGHAIRLAPSTRETVASRLAHAVAEFGRCYLDGIRPGDVRAWQAEMAREHSPSTCNGCLRLLRQVLDAAIVDEVLGSNPARAVRALPERRTTGRRGTALSLEEFRRFLVAAESMSGTGELSADLGRLVVLLAWTGLRKSEAMALRWDDVSDGELHVRRSVWRGREKCTKSGEPRRVAVVEPVRVALEEQRSWLLESQHPGLSSGLVFPASTGTRRRGANMVTWHRSPACLAGPLVEIARRAEVPEISPHSLRRTFEDLTRLAGVDAMTRRAVAGWRSEGVQGIYAGVSREEREAAGAAMLRLVRKGAGQ